MIKKPRPSIECMRADLIRFEIEEVYRSKDYQASLEADEEPGWKGEDDIIKYYKKQSTDEVEEQWLELFNQFAYYEDK